MTPQPAPPVDPVDDELAGRLRLVVARLARRLRQEADPGMSPSMAAALSSIDRFGPLTPSELADIERVRRPTVTRVLSNLEAEGLVVRAPDPDDGRVVRVGISAGGRRLQRRLRRRKSAYLARRLRGLDADERAVLARATGILERVLEDRS